MSQNLLVLGLQWGDEGKGKIIDVLSDNYDVVLRYQGGANAGHTVKVDDNEFILHLVPSGILRTEKLCVIGNGVVVDPGGLVEEIEGLRNKGVTVEDNLVVSRRAHAVMPFHQTLDNLNEDDLEEKKIGTTGRGIGPCYADKADRRGLRMGDLLDPDGLRPALQRLVDYKNRILTDIYGADPLDFDELYEQCCEWGEALEPHIQNTVVRLKNCLQDEQSILLEGAQGTMLDIDFGTYPYVTSSNVVAGGASVGSGIPPSSCGEVLGVVKAYTSRVGRGPFPSEREGEVGERLRTRGQEYGSTTGRPRRCGWLDAVALRHAAAVSGVERVVVTSLDVLGAFETVRICTAYEVDGERTTEFPATVREQEVAKPIYRELEGWTQDVTEARTWNELPDAARDYLSAVEEEVGVEVAMASVGPARSQIIGRTDI